MKYSKIRQRLIKGILHSNNHMINLIMDNFYKFTTTLFALATFYYAGIFIYMSLPFFYIIRIVIFLLILTIYNLYRVKIIDVDIAIAGNALGISLIVYLTLGYEIFFDCVNSPKHMLVEMSIFFVPMLMAALTKYRKLSLILTFGTLIIYSFAAYKLNDATLKCAIPIYFLILLGVRTMLVNTIKIISNINSENEKLTNEQKAMLNFFNLSREQWKLIKEGKLNREQAEIIVDQMEQDIREKLIKSLKETIQTEDEIKNILKKYHSDLTHGELQICYYIIQGKSVTDISKIKNITNSGVTLTRSRIRKKIGLKQDENLNDYLQSLVTQHMDEKNV